MQRHVIKKQVIEVKIGKREEAYALQTELSQLFKTRLKPLLNSFFDQLASNGQVVQLDKLELDLGTLSSKQLEADVESKLKEALAQALNQYNNPEEHPEQPNEEKQAGSFNELIFYFLQHGHLPWWAPGGLARQLPDEFMHYLAQPQHSKQVGALFNTVVAAPGNVALLKRLIYNFSDSLLAQFISTARGLPVQYLRNLVHDLKAVNAVPAQAYTNRYHTWVDLIGSLTDAQQAVPSQQQLLNKMVVQAAARRQITTGALVSQLQANTQTRLKAAYGAVPAQQANQALPAATVPYPEITRLKQWLGQYRQVEALSAEATKSMVALLQRLAKTQALSNGPWQRLVQQLRSVNYYAQQLAQPALNIALTQWQSQWGSLLRQPEAQMPEMQQQSKMANSALVGALTVLAGGVLFNTSQITTLQQAIQALLQTQHTASLQGFEAAQANFEKALQAAQVKQFKQSVTINQQLAADLTKTLTGAFEALYGQEAVQVANLGDWVWGMLKAVTPKAMNKALEGLLQLTQQMARQVNIAPAVGSQPPNTQTTLGQVPEVADGSQVPTPPQTPANNLPAAAGQLLVLLETLIQTIKTTQAAPTLSSEAATALATHTKQATELLAAAQTAVQVGNANLGHLLHQLQRLVIATTATYQQLIEKAATDTDQEPLEQGLAKLQGAPIDATAVQDAWDTLRQEITTELEQVQAAPPKADAPVAESDFSQSDSLYVDMAGLVILWPYLKNFFVAMELMNTDAEFVSESARHYAVLLLLEVALPGIGMQEASAVIAKVLCGLHPEAVLQPPHPIEKDHQDSCQVFLEALIEQAPILKTMTADGLRGTFLLREGTLGRRDGEWLLRVERQTHDVILDKFPWTFNIVKLSWMPSLMYVEW